MKGALGTLFHSIWAPLPGKSRGHGHDRACRNQWSGSLRDLGERLSRSATGPTCQTSSRAQFAPRSALMMDWPSTSALWSAPGWSTVRVPVFGLHGKEPPSLKFDPSKPTGPYNRVSDLTLCREGEAGMDRRLVSFRDGLHATIDWYLDPPKRRREREFGRAYADRAPEPGPAPSVNTTFRRRPTPGLPPGPSAPAGTPYAGTRVHHARSAPGLRAASIGSIPGTSDPSNGGRFHGTAASMSD